MVDLTKSAKGKQSLQLRYKIPTAYDISEEVLKRADKEIRADTKETLKFLEALSHPIRLRILRALRANELCVCVFIALMRIKYSKLSYHLKLLKNAGLVDSKKDRNFLEYRITDLGRRILKSIEKH